ncbi:MAG: hypothetical protein KAW89_04635 [Armatimonadetes bacterium]|nr:hypothetical protein [Armatimonadota bacterium]
MIRQCNIDSEVGLVIVVALVFGLLLALRSRPAMGQPDDLPPDLQKKVDTCYGLASTPAAPGDAEAQILQSLLAGSLHRYPPLISSISVNESPGDWIAPSLNLTVLHDGEKFRMWYDVRDTRAWQDKPEAWLAAIAYAESDDGIHWHRPKLDLHPYYPGVDNVTFLRGDNYCIAVTVVDDGRDCQDRARRFKIAVDSHNNMKDFGTYIAFSPDGIHWAEYEGNPIWRSPEFGDILDAYYDKDNGIYIMAYKKWEKLPGFQTHGAGQRCVGIATSEDWIHWDNKGVVIRPDEDDDHFYGMSLTKIDGLYVGFLRIYQSTIGPNDGIGWTEVATSTDLTEWKRYRKPFVPRGPVGSFDHAMLWLDAPLQVDNALYYYYGGYPQGHAHASDRGIGLITVTR